MTKQNKKIWKVKGWVVLVDGKPNIANGMFETELDATNNKNWSTNLPVVPCTISYTLPITKKPKK